MFRADLLLLSGGPPEDLVMFYLALVPSDPLRVHDGYTIQHLASSAQNSSG